ncbi:uncharacterized protein LOC111704201 [Eurytemora carolleeae]|uniref:uncharacterized protein LOC111704201 n=1 Tax=Eurytemora carolleeae TaxID=1294199 RepID=UPI000C78CD22|nr:uncharacterized protein LOC111704201 [Eurytemora carolleeae]|eukprot:XP_023332123.1 uncharacterized protein LOC111704201 [Eurytemora affinis]
MCVDIEINVNREELHENVHVQNKKFFDLIKQVEYPRGQCEGQPFAEKLSTYQRNYSTTDTKLSFPDAEESVLRRLLELNAFRSLTNKEDKTPYSLALEKGCSTNILELLKIPSAVEENKESIEAIEQSLHKIICELVEELLEKNGQSLPKISLLWERCEDSAVFYPVPGMYGGFLLYLDRKNNELTVESFCRIVGGSERCQIIDRTGKVTEGVFGKARRRKHRKKVLCCF